MSILMIGIPMYRRDLKRSRNGFSRIITPYSRVFIVRTWAVVTTVRS